MSHLKWGDYTVLSNGHRIEAAKVKVDFYVTREDLVGAAVMAIDEVITCGMPDAEVAFAAAQLRRVHVERKLRDMLQSYGTIFTEFGPDGKTIAFGDTYALMCTQAELVVSRLYPHLDNERL